MSAIPSSKAVAAKVGRAKRSPPAEAKPRARTEPASGSGKTVGAVAGAVKILRYLSESAEPVGVSRVAKGTALNTSTCFNILRTLAASDLVQFDSGAKTYRLGLGILELAKGVTALRGDIGSVRPRMERIATEHGVTVTLWQPISETRKVLIMTALARNAMRIQLALGQRLPIYHGGTGRVFAAFGDATRAELRKRYDEIRWDRALDYEAFLAQVEDARQRGWAVDDGNFAEGAVSLAAPVLDRNGKAVAAVTATMFAGQYDEVRARDIVADLRELCRDLALVMSSPMDF